MSLKEYLYKEWVSNVAPKYLKYFDEWFNLTENQLQYFEAWSRGLKTI